MSGNVDYSYYTDKFGGALSPGAFEAELPNAIRLVNWLCGGRKPQRCEVCAWKRAVCACCDALAEHGHGAGRSWELGEFRVGAPMASGGTGSRSGRAMTGEDYAVQAAQMELCGTSLLFTGVR